MNPMPRTVDEIIKAVQALPPEDRKRVATALQVKVEGGGKRRSRPSFYEARNLLAGIKGSLADDIIAERDDRL